MEVIIYYKIYIKAIPKEEADFYDMVINNVYGSRKLIEMKEKIIMNPTIDLTNLEDEWAKSYKAANKIIRDNKEDIEDDRVFFIPKLLYVPTKMPPLMEEMYGGNSLENKLERIQNSVNKLLLQSVYHNYLYLIDSARYIGNKENEKEFTKKAEEILAILNSLD